jgi:hypothetical protein
MPSAANAAGPSQPHVDPAVAQYIEMIPTAEGAAASGSGGHQAAIPAPARKKIEQQAGANAGLLTKVVQSQSYGAPAQFQSEPPPQPTEPAPTTTATTTTAPTTTASTTTTPKATARKAKHPKPAATPAWVAPAPAALPPPPNAFSTALGSVGADGVLFALVLVGVLGFAALPRLTRK